jgi:hypothetical protein
MLTRRDALRLAAAMSAARAPLFPATAADAALDAPATFWPEADRPSLRAHEPTVADPLAFAESLDALDVDNTLFANGAPEEWAAYKQLLAHLAAQLPATTDAGTDDLRALLEELDEAAVDLSTVSWMGGVRAGVAYEHLRLALMADRQVCPRCHGYGRLWDDRPLHVAQATDEPTVSIRECPVCAGTGTTLAVA